VIGSAELTFAELTWRFEAGARIVSRAEGAPVDGETPLFHVLADGRFSVVADGRPPEGAGGTVIALA